MDTEIKSQEYNTESISRITSGNSTYYIADLEARDAIQHLTQALQTFVSAYGALDNQITQMKTDYNTEINNQLNNLKLPVMNLNSTEINYGISMEKAAIWLDVDYDWRIKKQSF